jgi:glycosyltransferase involved in cell wall biosynthesis
VRASNYHAHNTFFLPGMYFSKMIYGGVLIYDSHEVQWESSKLASLKEKYFINKVDKIINVSHGRAKAQAERYNIPINNICVISNYPMLSKNIVQKQKIGNDKYTRFVFSGGLSLTDNKIDNFIRAIKDYPEISFDLLAFCYDNSEMILKNLIRDYKLENRVKFLPLVKPNEVLSTITEYDFTVNLMTNPQNLITINYHSINKIYEAISAGLPILCSDLPSFKDEIVDNGIGYSVNPFSVDSIKKGIEAIKKNDHKVMREKAFELAEKRFNWANEEVKLLNLYKNL